MNTSEAVIYLAGCAVNGTVPERETVEQMDLDAVYALAQRHMLSAAVAAALESAGYKDERSALAIGISVRRALFFDRERKAVCAALEEAGIWYVLMKGLVLRQ